MTGTLTYVLTDRESGATMLVLDTVTATAAANCRATLNGRACSLGDLQPGDRVTCAGDPVRSVEAVR